MNYKLGSQSDIDSWVLVTKLWLRDEGLYCSWQSSQLWLHAYIKSTRDSRGAVFYDYVMWSGWNVMEVFYKQRWVVRKRTKGNTMLFAKLSVKCWEYLANETSQILVVMDWPPGGGDWTQANNICQISKNAWRIFKKLCMKLTKMQTNLLYM